jgi:SRSO17 transposase
MDADAIKSLGPKFIDFLWRFASCEHSDTQRIGIIDETSFVKKVGKTPGVQFQYCGAVGKHKN